MEEPPISAIPYKPYNWLEIGLLLLTALVLFPVPVTVVMGITNIIQPLNAVLWSLLFVGISIWLALLTFILVAYRLMSAVQVLRTPVDNGYALLKQLGKAFGANMSRVMTDTQQVPSA
jgi:membrane protein implicated in regulation of membrane protease activity